MKATIEKAHEFFFVGNVAKRRLDLRWEWGVHSRSIGLTCSLY